MPSKFDLNNSMLCVTSSRFGGKTALPLLCPSVVVNSSSSVHVLSGLANSRSFNLFRNTWKSCYSSKFPFIEEIKTISYKTKIHSEKDFLLISRQLVVLQCLIFMSKICCFPASLDKKFILVKYSNLSVSFTYSATLTSLFTSVYVFKNLRELCTYSKCTSHVHGTNIMQNVPN